MNGRAFRVVVVNDTRVDRHHGCSRVMSALETLISRIGGEVAYRLPAHADWSVDGNFDSQLANSRLMVINGEGTLHHDRPAGKRLLLAAAHARSMGVPVALVNAGWEANGVELTALLDNVDLLAVRDSQSADELHRAGRACRVVPDLSLYAPAAEPTGVRRGVGYTDSVNPSMSVMLDRSRRERGGVPVAIQYSLPGGAARLWFLREAVSRGDLRFPLRMARLLRARAAQLRAQVGTTEEFIGRLGALELLVSGRFHACTLSLLAGTPFVAVPSNTGKIAALVRDAGLQAWRAHALLDEKSLASARREGWLPYERESVGDYIASARQGADALFSDIGRLV